MVCIFLILFAVESEESNATHYIGDNLSNRGGYKMILKHFDFLFNLQHLVSWLMLYGTQNNTVCYLCRDLNIKSSSNT